MKPTTVTTCEDNVPHPVLFLDEAELNKALTDHYSAVWREVDAEGPCPQSWSEIREQLELHDLLRDRHVAHLHTHDLFRQADAA